MIGIRSIINRKAGEEIVFHLRRHWFIFFKMFLASAILLVLPLGILFFLYNAFPGVFAGDISYPLILVLTFSYYLIIVALVFTWWTETYLDVWTVTTERIINIEQNGLFNRVVSELELYQVQDVTAEQKGFFATIFHYGEVYIQTAATRERFVFEEVPGPYRVAKIIQKLAEEAKKKHQMIAN